MRKVPIAMLLSSLALLVLPAAAAALSLFEAGEYPAEVIGAQSETQVFTAEGGLTVKCKATSQTGWISGGVAELEVTPSFSECVSTGETAATVATEGCAYRFHAGSASMDIVCPTGKAIKITALAGSCEATIGSQSGLKSIEYANNAGPPKTVSVHPKVEKIRYTKTKDSFLCPFSGTGEKEDGTFSGSAMLKGFGPGGGQTDFFVGEEAGTTLCEEATPTCLKPYAQGSEVDAVNTGNPVLKYVLSGKAETVTCLASNFEGTTTAPQGAEAGASITAFNFGNCMSTNSLVCSVSGQNLPWRGSFFTSEPKAGKGTLELVASAKGKTPAIKVTCNKIECVYAAVALFRGDVTGGTPASLSEFWPLNAMNRSGGNAMECSATLNFEKTPYKFEKPVSGEAKMWLTN